jgi:hypothetical protein
MTVYVYGITRVPFELPDVAGVGGASLRLVRHEDVAAVVSDAGDEPLRATAAGLKAHTKVLDELVAEGTVLPLRFGTVVTDDAAVEDALLRVNAPHLRELLDRLDGHVQLTVKVFNDEDTVLREVVETDGRVSSLWRKVQGLPPEAAYYDRITLGQEIARALEQRKVEVAQPLYDALVALSAEAQAKEPRQDLMVLDADFLVARSDLEQFDAEVDALAKDRPELEFRYLGPMPAYSFADLVLQGAD